MFLYIVGFISGVIIATLGMLAGIVFLYEEDEDEI